MKVSICHAFSSIKDIEKTTPSKTTKMTFLYFRMKLEAKMLLCRLLGVFIPFINLLHVIKPLALKLKMSNQCIFAYKCFICAYKATRLLMCRDAHTHKTLCVSHTLRTQRPHWFDPDGGVRSCAWGTERLTCSHLHKTKTAAQSRGDALLTSANDKERHLFRVQI